MYGDLIRSAQIKNQGVIIKCNVDKLYDVVKYMMTIKYRNYKSLLIAALIYQMLINICAHTHTHMVGPEDCKKFA